MTKPATPDTLITVKIDSEDDLVLLFAQVPTLMANLAKAYKRNGGDVVALFAQTSTQALKRDDKIEVIQRLVSQVNR